MATLTKSTGTVTLSGSAEKVTLPAAYGWVWLKNMSDADMFAGLSADISEGADGVMVIPSGECGRIQTDGFNSIYLMGSGNALVVAQNYADCPFKVGGKGGESPDLSPYAKKTDVPNIKVNAAGNADTVGGHTVGCDVPENAVFTDTVPDLSAYAKKTDIPTELPANGGNADTVNGHTVDADVPADAVFTDTIPDLTPYALKSKYGDTTIDVGRKAGTTVGIRSTAEGYNTTASAQSSHAEGDITTASAQSSHAEGYNTTASGNASHAEGRETTASGQDSHAEGQHTTASGYCSHAGGANTNALHDFEVAYGNYNQSNSDTLFSIGDGTSGTARHNAFEITTTGGMLHDKDILTSAHCIQFIPYNLKYYALSDRILLFSNDDALASGIYFVNNTPNDITVCALISASAAGPAVQYGYGSSTYPEIQNTGEGREWFSEESIPTSPTIFVMTVPSGKLGYYGVYHNSETAYTTIHDIRCPYFNYF